MSRPDPIAFAAEFARRAHTGHRCGDAPYIVHIEAVAECAVTIFHDHFKAKGALYTRNGDDKRLLREQLVQIAYVHNAVAEGIAPRGRPCALWHRHRRGSQRGDLHPSQGGASRL